MGQKARRRHLEPYICGRGDEPCRLCCVPLGAIFRVPGRFAKAATMEAGQGTDWMFAGLGKEVAGT